MTTSDRDPDALERLETWVATLKALPGYPWLPCPICKGDEGCSHAVPERARAAIPGLVLTAREPGVTETEK